MNRLLKINEHGQSIWLDLLDRNLMDSGKLKKMIDEDGLKGLTSNPAIFAKAISGSNDYDSDITEFKKNGAGTMDVFFELAIKDIRRAADIFRPVYDSSNGKDGYVSLEVSPDLANNSSGTIEQARELWQKLDRKNVMIKIPATPEGLVAIRTCISEGININVTLIFGLERYKKVMNAYTDGLEDRLDKGGSISGIHSVASFFLSRIDVMVEPLLVEKNLTELKGEVAISLAKKAYAIFEKEFMGDWFKGMESKGANRQRLLWASTSVKDPSFRDVKYVEALIGKDTVNTLPLETLEDFKDHGKVTDSLTSSMDKASEVLDRLLQKNIDLDELSNKLEIEGIGKFNKPFEKLLAEIENQA